ncbi:MAG: CDP-glycerol glycerophosphotransferase family protein [Candidatus Diapherotrites archaeon]|nr:CDP-glycerol glycerophosphotransferase family protein [Candidatus Diapherotrites archaeon]
MFEHIKELFEFFRSNDKFLPILIKSRPKTKDIIETWEISLPYHYLPYVKADFFLDVAITSYPYLCSSVIKFLYAHGISSLGFSKDFRHIKYVNRYDYLLLTGPLQKKAIFLAAEKYHVPSLPKLVEIGFLKGDKLLREQLSFSKEDFIKQKGYFNKKTVLFAPTWGQFSAVHAWMHHIIKIGSSMDINLLIKLHPLMLRKETKWHTVGGNCIKMLWEVSKKFKNISVITEENIYNYLLFADILITDASSVGLEFILLGKPTIFLPCPRYFEIYGKDRPIFWCREGMEVSSVADLRRRLELYLTGGQKNNGMKLNDIVYNPGKGLMKMVEFLNSFS